MKEDLFVFDLVIDYSEIILKKYYFVFILEN